MQTNFYDIPLFCSNDLKTNFLPILLHVLKKVKSLSWNLEHDVALQLSCHTTLLSAQKMLAECDVISLWSLTSWDNVVPSFIWPLTSLLLERHENMVMLPLTSFSMAAWSLYMEEICKSGQKLIHPSKKFVLETNTLFWNKILLKTIPPKFPIIWYRIE